MEADEDDYPLYATCLNAIKASGVRVSEIVDETVALRFWGSGTPYPFKWPDEPDDVWILRSSLGERDFRGESEKTVDVARTVQQVALRAIYLK